MAHVCHARWSCAFATGSPCDPNGAMDPISRCHQFRRIGHGFETWISPAPKGLGQASESLFSIIPGHSSKDASNWWPGAK
jgi:hypothetical protein